MELKLWEKKENSFKELLTIPIKLLPFFNAYSNPIIANQFHKEKVSEKLKRFLNRLLKCHHSDARCIIHRLD